jgi:S1-C subfamily serine protease
MFYYSDDETKELEVTQVSSEYNIGISKAINSSLKVRSILNDIPIGHGSGNLFYIGSRLFVVTAAHVIDDGETIMLEEHNGNLVEATIAYENHYTDIAILMPREKFENTKPSAYLINKSHDIKAKRVHFYGYPQSLEGFLAMGFVSQSDYRKILLQSYAWFGASGAVVFDSAGRTVGVVSAIVSQMDPYSGSVITPGNIVVVTRTYDLDRKKIREHLINEETRSWNPN